MSINLFDFLLLLDLNICSDNSTQINWRPMVYPRDK